MAHVQKCKYCQKDVIDSRWHSLCRRGKLEDLLYRIQQRLNKGIDGVSDVLEHEILAETFRSKEEIEQEFKRVEELEQAKERWKNDFIEAMQEAAADWQKEHPDPDPPTC